MFACRNLLVFIEVQILKHHEGLPRHIAGIKGKLYIHSPSNTLRCERGLAGNLITLRIEQSLAGILVHQLTDDGVLMVGSQMAVIHGIHDMSPLSGVNQVGIAVIVQGLSAQLRSEENGFLLLVRKVFVLGDNGVVIVQRLKGDNALAVQNRCIQREGHVNAAILTGRNELSLASYQFTVAVTDDIAGILGNEVAHHFIRVTGHEVGIGHGIRDSDFVQGLKVVVQRDAFVDGRMNRRGIHSDSLAFIIDVLMDSARSRVRSAEIQFLVDDQRITVKPRSIKGKYHLGAALRGGRRKRVRHGYGTPARNHRLTGALIHHRTSDGVLLTDGKVLVCNRILDDNILCRVNELSSTLTVNSGSADFGVIYLHGLVGICIIFVNRQHRTTVGQLLEDNQRMPIQLGSIKDELDIYCTGLCRRRKRRRAGNVIAGSIFQKLARSFIKDLASQQIGMPFNNLLIRDGILDFYAVLRLKELRSVSSIHCVGCYLRSLDRHGLVSIVNVLMRRNRHFCADSNMVEFLESNELDAGNLSGVEGKDHIHRT